MVSKGMLRARIFALICFFSVGEKINKAVKRFNDEWNSKESPTIKNVARFINLRVKHFRQSGTVADAPRGGRPRKLPNKVVQWACDLFKEGYTVMRPRPPGPGMETVQCFYTSIHDACKKNGTLAWVCSEYTVSPETLLDNMKAIDPNLVRRSTDVKVEHTAQQKLNRQRVAIDCMERLTKDKLSVQRVTWIDASSIELSNPAKMNHLVYCDKRDTRVCHVIADPRFSTSKKIYLKFVAAVNYDNGPVYLDFTTGTTALKRYEEHPEPKKSYLVSQMLPSCCWLTLQGWPMLLSCCCM